MASETGSVTWRVVAGGACALLLSGMGFVASALGKMSDSIDALKAGGAETRTMVAVLATRVDGVDKTVDALRVAVEAASIGRYTAQDAQRDFSALQKQVDLLATRVQNHHDRLTVLETKAQ